MKLGIAIVPSSDTIKSIVELQKTLMPIYPLSPQLGTNVNLPHITLLQGRFHSQINWVSLIADLRNYCREQKYSLEFNKTGLEYKPPGWIFLKLSQNMIFFQAHRFVFERLKDLMFLTSEERLKYTGEYTLLEKQNYFQYGYRYIGDAFHPHITLGKLMNKSLVNPDSILRSMIESFKLNCVGVLKTITVYQMGENGSHAVTLHHLEI